MRIAVTGGIASGKTYVLHYLRRLGFSVLSADLLVSEFLLCDPSILDTIASVMPDAVTSDSRIDKASMMNSFVRNPDLLNFIESLLHPLLRSYIINLPQEDAPIFIEVPLLFEVGWCSDYNFIVSTVVPYNEQMARVLQRGNMNESAFVLLYSRQVDDDYRIGNSDYIINTNYSKSSTELQTRAMLKNLGL